MATRHNQSGSRSASTRARYDHRDRGYGVQRVQVLTGRDGARGPEHGARHAHRDPVVHGSDRRGVGPPPRRRPGSRPVLAPGPAPGRRPVGGPTVTHRVPPRAVRQRPRAHGRDPRGLGRPPTSATPTRTTRSSRCRSSHASAGTPLDEFRSHYRDHVDVARRHMPALWQYRQHDVDRRRRCAA